jgi:hypothetical protein
MKEMSWAGIRRRAKKARGLGVLGVSLAAGLLLASPASASSGAGARPDAAIPGALNSVSCPAANECWAVGDSVGTTSNQAVMANWNGTAWTQTSIPAPPGAADTGLASVSCASTSYCWAVGYSQNSSGGTSVPYGLNWDGTAWSLGSLSSTAGDSTISCDSTTDCWSAGGGTSSLGHWNGTTWNVVSVPALGAPFGPALSCVSTSDCWLVGANPTGGGTLTAQWNGSAWSVVHTPTSKLGSHLLSGVSCTGTTCMAVGGNGARGKNIPIAQRWNGSTWKITPAGTTTTAKHAELFGVSCATSANCVAVGYRIGRRSPGAFSELWNGTVWKKLTTPTATGGLYELLVVSCVTTSDCWAVGGVPGVMATSLIEHWNGSAWSISS